MRSIFIGSRNINEKPIENYLTFQALEDNLQISFTNQIEYCIDYEQGKSWTSLEIGHKTQPINYGQKISFRGNLSELFAPSKYRIVGVGTFSATKDVM